MSVELLLKEFHRISEAPDAVPRLRRFILNLAVRGKLVPQNSADEPADALLKRIEVCRLQLFRAGTHPLPKLPPVSGDEMPYPLPPTWRWIRLADAFQYDSGDKIEPSGIPAGSWLLELEDIEKDSGKILSKTLVEQRLPKSTKSKFLRGDVLYGKLRPYLNKAIVADAPGFSTTEIVAIRCYGDSAPSYTSLALRRPDFVAYVDRLGQGTKMPRLRTEDALKGLFPLPPVPEQHRIAARVEQLMTLCDELQSIQSTREARREKLVTASLARLTAAADEISFKESARFYFNNLPRLTRRLEDLSKLQHAIIDMAVRGHLSAQDNNDESASGMLRRVLREQHVGHQQRSDPADEKLDTEAPFPTPPSWVRVRLCQAGKTFTGTTPSKTNPANLGDYIPFVKPADLTSREISYSGEGLSKLGMAEARVIPSGSVLMVCIGSSLGKVNRTKRDICCNQQINAIYPHELGWSEYIEIALKSTYFQDLAWANAGTGTLPIISKGKWEQLPIPLPPLAEQRRILEAYKVIREVLDSLRNRIEHITSLNSALLSAALPNALGSEPNQLHAVTGS